MSKTEDKKKEASREKENSKNTKGKITTGAVTVGVTAALGLGMFFSDVGALNIHQTTTIERNKDNDDEQKESSQRNELSILEDTNQEISLADTKDYKVIKVKSAGEVRDEDAEFYFKNRFTKYYIIKEFYFPYSEKLGVKNLYTLVDIDTNKSVLYRDEDNEVVTSDGDSQLDYVELGSLTDYLVKYDYIKARYQKDEFQDVLEKIEGENPNKDKIDFYDTTRLNILELESKKTGKLSWHIVRYWPSPIGIDNDVCYNSLYEDIMINKSSLSERFVLEVDGNNEVVDQYKDYSYQMLGSLTDYLVTYNVVQPEYNKNDFKTILDKVAKERAPEQMVKNKEN